MSEIYATLNINLNIDDVGECRATARAILRALRELEWDCTGLEPFPFYPTPSLIPPGKRGHCTTLVVEVGCFLSYRTQRFTDGFHAIAKMFKLDYIDVELRYRNQPMLGLRVGPLAHLHNNGLFDADAFIRVDDEIRKPYDFIPDPYVISRSSS